MAKFKHSFASLVEEGKHQRSMNWDTGEAYIDTPHGPKYCENGRIIVNQWFTNAPDNRRAVGAWVSGVSVELASDVPCKLFTPEGEEVKKAWIIELGNICIWLDYEHRMAINVEGHRGVVYPSATACPYPRPGITRGDTEGIRYSKPDPKKARQWWKDNADFVAVCDVTAGMKISPPRKPTNLDISKWGDPEKTWFGNMRNSNEEVRKKFVSNNMRTVHEAPYLLIDGGIGHGYGNRK